MSDTRLVLEITVAQRRRAADVIVDAIKAWNNNDICHGWLGAFNYLDGIADALGITITLIPEPEREERCDHDSRFDVYSGDRVAYSRCRECGTVLNDQRTHQRRKGERRGYKDRREYSSCGRRHSRHISDRRTGKDRRNDG